MAVLDIPIVTLCNDALSMVGKDEIQSLDGDSQEAKLCKRHYQLEVDAVIRLTDWNAARKRKVLTAMNTPPAFGDFTKQCMVPNDCLRVLRVLDSSNTPTDWKKENDPTGAPFGVILCDESTIHVLYSKRIQDPNEMDALLRDTVVARLAWKLSYPLTRDRNIQKDMFALYTQVLKEGRLINRRESKQEKASNFDQLVKQERGPLDIKLDASNLQ